MGNYRNNESFIASVDKKGLPGRRWTNNCTLRRKNMGSGPEHNIHNLKLFFISGPALIFENSGGKTLYF